MQVDAGKGARKRNHFDSRKNTVVSIATNNRYTVIVEFRCRPPDRGEKNEVEPALVTQNKL